MNFIWGQEPEISECLCPSHFLLFFFNSLGSQLKEWCHQQFTDLFTSGNLSTAIYQGCTEAHTRDDSGKLMVAIHHLRDRTGLFSGLQNMLCAFLIHQLVYNGKSTFWPPFFLEMEK